MKKDQYLDRNDYQRGAEPRPRPDVNTQFNANKCKEQDAIFVGIMLTRLFSSDQLLSQQSFKNLRRFF